MMSAATG